MKWLLTVLLAGLFVAGPFLTNRAMGTNEAYNYSLATADALQQFRAGELPVLVGQTEYAFNGRVHPLRTAPAFAHAAGLLDLLTLRRLGFWTLQNLVLALSLVAAGVGAYWMLRRHTPATPAWAAGLAALYLCNPAVLAAAYGMDLYMTVLVVPLLPLAIGASISCLQDRSRSELPSLALVVAAAWLAHPPVALWLSAVVAVLQLAALLLCPPDRRGLARSVFATLLFGGAAAFAFLSALTVSSYGSIVHQRDTSLLLAETQRVFAASFLPVSARADQLGDFQAGYVVWLMAGTGLLLAIVRRHATALLLFGVALGLMLFTVPVPFIHRWLWEHVPTLVINLTNQWPMQRLYLPFAALVIFGFALVGRVPEQLPRLARDLVRLGIWAAAVWTLWQAWPFVSRGYRTRQSETVTARSHLPGNIDLTPISYALLGTPPDFTNGVMDPAFSFRLLAPFDAHPVASNWTAPLPATSETRTLELVARAGDSPDLLPLGEPLRLEPGVRYRLTFEFLAPPQPAVLQIKGSHVFREYRLPSAGGPLGFGQIPGNNQALSLWTDQPQAETVRFQLAGPNLASSSLRGRPFARMKLEPVDPKALPVELQSLLPLRCRVTAAAAGYLETPRAFVPGYVATVNGAQVRTQRSPGGLVMLAVPAGASQVELRYEGSPALRMGYWLTFATWVAVAVTALLRHAPASVRNIWAGFVAEAISRLRSRVARRMILGLAAMAVLLLAGGFAVRKWLDYRHAVGPVRIRFVLPRGESGRQQPLLVTGRPGAGAFFVVGYVDDRHIRVGFDSWGLMGAYTEPIEVDYFAEHELVIHAGALYPPDHPRVRALPEALRQKLRQQVRLELNGRVVLARTVDTHESRPSDITVGTNLIGGSSAEPAFAGQILTVERLPIPTE